MSFMDNRKCVQKLQKTTNEEELKELLSKLFNQVGFNTHLPYYNAGLNLWRIVDLPQRGNTVKDFGYPPAPESCRLGRCNKQNQQVFYASQNLGTCLSETKKLENGTQFRAGLWKTKDELRCLDTTQEENTNTKSAKVYKVMNMMFDYIGEEYYLQTSTTTDWVCNELNYEFSISGNPSWIHGIRYPSTLRSCDDKSFTNFALSKQSVDALGLELSEWYHFEVIESTDNSCVVRSIAEGSLSQEGISESNQLKWRENSSTAFITIPRDTKIKFNKEGSVWVSEQAFKGYSPYKECHW